MFLIPEPLLSALKLRLPSLSLRVEPSAEGDEIVIGAAHPAVGDLRISRDGPEAIVEIGSITHGHFASYEEGLSLAAASSSVIESLVDFIADVVSDRVLFWRAKGGGAGGWRVFNSEADMSNLGTTEGVAGASFEAERFLWSGPLAS